jgi:hypothetical protein
MTKKINLVELNKVDLEKLNAGRRKGTGKKVLHFFPANPQPAVS